MNYFCLLLTIVCCLPLAIRSGPVSSDPICQGDGLYNYDNKKEYEYGFFTKTKLWINDVSEDAESVIRINATVKIQRVEPCRYQLKLSNVYATASSSVDSASIASELQKNVAVFSIGSNGELSSAVKFNGADSDWSRNIKRGIISAFQLRAESDLKSDPLNANSAEKSSVVYETDLFGRCRTTYKSKKTANGLEFVKSKALHRCSLERYRDSPVQADEYASTAEYYNGHVYIENHRCSANVKNGVLNSVSCKQESTVRRGSRGDNGVQAVAELYLNLYTTNAASSVAPLDRAAPSSIIHTYQQEEVEASSLDTAALINEVCTNTNKGVLGSQHARKFRELINVLRTKSKADLLKLVNDASAKCKFAANTVIAALVFAETDNSVEAVLDLMDKDVFRDSVLITEFPLLTAVARQRHPTAQLINKFKTYLAGKDASFVYLQKSFLIYSTLISTFCSENDCKANLDGWSSVLVAQLGTNCADAKNKAAVAAALKAIGNVGYVKDTSVLEKCAANKDNSFEVRVAAIQAFRQFSCSQTENLDGNYKLLQDGSDDAEVRINAFRSLVRCLNSAKFQTFASKAYSDLLLKDEDYQVISYIIDFAKERGVTVLLNPILNSPEIRDKLQLNFKEFSWNNYKFRYSVVRDAALEVDTSVIYTGKTFIPRSLNFNITLHGYGLRINALDVTLRLEGLDEGLKALLVDKIPVDQLPKYLMENPQQLLDILKSLADKLKFSAEKPYLSLAVRVYGSDVFFVQLDTPEKVHLIGSALVNLKALLYKERNTLRNMQIFNLQKKRALLNGFEFEQNHEANLAVLHTRKGERQVKGSRTEFNLKLQNGVSVFVQREFSVEINEKNKLTLKKDIEGSLRLKLDYDGYRQDGAVQYNINIQPEEVVQLFVLEGKFFKLGQNNKFVEVKEWKIPQKVKSRCTSQNFHDHVGLDACFSASRPDFRKLREIAKSLNSRENDMDVYEDEDDFDFNAKDDDEEDDENDNDGDFDIDRPMITLAGPYRYELALRNSEGLNKFVIAGKTTTTEESKRFEGSLTSSSNNKAATRRLDLVYSRHRSSTNRAYKRGLSLELKVPQDNDVRFHFSSEVDYRQKELLDYRLRFENKILKEVSLNVHFNRKHKVEGQSISNYTLEATYDSKLFSEEGTYIHSLASLAGIGKSIKGEAFVENRDAKFVEGRLDLEHNDGSSYDKDYDLKASVNSVIGMGAEAGGHIKYGLLSSDILVNVNFKSPDSGEEGTPLQVKVGHHYSSQDESHVLFDVNTPIPMLSFGGKVAFQFTELKRSISIETNNAESKLKDEPRRVYYTFTRSQNQLERKLEFGVKNWNYDLSDSSTRLGELIKKATDDSTLREFGVEYSFSKDLDTRRTDITFEVDANDIAIESVHFYYFGNLDAIRANPAEVSETPLGAGLEFKVFDYKGSLKASGKIANSNSKKTRSVSINVAATDLLRTALKLNELDINSDTQGGKINFKGSLVKEADQYKSIEISANGPVRESGATREFDFNYVKTLNDGSKKSGKGTAKYTATDASNFDGALDVPKLFNVKATVVNERKEGHVLNKVQLGLAHLDNPEPVEKRFKFELHRHTDKVRTAELSIEARNGKPGKLDNEDGLNYLVGLGGKITKATLPTGEEKLIGYQQNLRYKSAQRKFDITSESVFAVDLQNKVVKLNGKTDGKFPSFLSGSKEVRFLKRNLNAQVALDRSSAKVDYSFETDSTVLGSFLRQLDGTFQYQLGQQKLVDASFAAKYRKAPQPDDAQPKQKNLKLNLAVVPCSASNPCVDVNLGVEHQIDETCPKANINFKYSRTSDAGNLNANAGLKVNCAELSVTDTKVQYTRTAQGEYRPKREIKITSESNLYEPKSLEWAFLPFNKVRGYAKLGLFVSDEMNFAKSFEYTREVDSNTNRMVSAEYKASTTYNTNFKKNCVLTINKKTDYSNKITCSLNVPSVPKTLNYGYSIFVANPKELFFGQRNFAISAQLPTGRVLQVEYKGFRSTPIDGTDDDKDPNDEREFNGTARAYWDYNNDKSKVLTLNLKRNNIAPGQFQFFIEAVDTPLIKVARLEVNNKRSFNETNLNLGLSYELKNGKKNRFDLFGKLNSDLVESSFSLEANLQRPKFNIQYSNEYNKLNGKLHQLRIRVAEFLTLVVNKEYDPNNRRLSVELSNSVGQSYKVEANSKYENDVYTVDGTLKKGNSVVSTVKSVYDSSNTLLSIKVNAVASKTQYDLRFGLLTESQARGDLKQDNKLIGDASVDFVPVKIVDRIPLHDIVVSLRWNRFWRKFQENVLGSSNLASASESSNLPAGYDFNSYFGDVYGELINDLKPVADSIKEQRALLRADIVKSYLLHLEFIGVVIPRAEERRQEIIKSLTKNKMAPEPELPLYKRLFARYNSLAEKLNTAFEKVYASKFRRFAHYIPRLSRISYNGEGSDKTYENNVVIKKRTLRAANLYQFNAEYRNRVRAQGNAILRIKSLLVRDVKGISIRALIQKYKYRSIRHDYTIVGSVFNKRNIIGYGGESESLHTQSKYLLAHDAAKNRFSIVLNYDASASTITTYFYGKGPISISSEKVTINNKPVALPQEISIGNGKSIYVGRISNGICVHVDNEVKVCCYEESGSCSVAMTRWWTGKVNGLFGKSNNFPQKLRQEDWSIDKVEFRKAQLKPPTEDAVKKCYQVFGSHRRSPFSRAALAVKMGGWRKVCEAALSFDQKNYCPLLKAFAEHAQLEYVHVRVPSECYQCQNKNLKKSYKIGEKVASGDKDESDVVKGSDYVFISLPCDSKKFGFNYEALLQGFNKEKDQSNNYYAIKIDKDETSVYQAENGNFVNFDLKAAAPVLQRDANGQIHEHAFYEALHYAQTLFAKRVASARYLVIVSCGNCLPYSARQVRKISKQLSARNIIVSSWGDYTINLGEDAEGEVAVGYNEDELHLYSSASKEFNVESLSSYKAEHAGDLCHRLAVRTHGSVFDVKEVRKPAVLSKVPEWFKEHREKHTFTLKSCTLVHNHYFGDFSDFKFSKAVHEEHDDDNDDDIDNPIRRIKLNEDDDEDDDE